MYGDIKNSQFWAKVFFYSPRNVSDFKNFTKGNVSFVEYKDLVSITTTTGVNDTVGTFSLSFKNNNLRYMEGDNIEEELSTYKELESESLQSEPNAYRNFSYLRDKDTFYNFKYETVVEGSNRYRVHYEILPSDMHNTVNEDRPLDYRSKRWFFRRDKNNPSKRTPVFIHATYNDDGTITYNELVSKTFLGNTYGSTIGNELEVEVHTNRELYNKYHGQMNKTQCIISPMDYAYIFMANEVDDDGYPIYKRVFTGLINKVSLNRSGDDTVLIDGEDITKLLKLSVFSTNTQIFEKPAIESEPTNFIYANNLSTSTASEIIRKMVTGITRGIVTKDLKNELIKTDFKVDNESSDISDDVGTVKEKDLDKSKIEEYFFSTGLLDIQNPTDPELSEISRYKPFVDAFGNDPPDVITEYKDRLQICQEVAKIMNFEFFANPDGKIVFRQPKFDNYHILNADNPETYILHSNTIHNYSVSEDDSQVITGIRIHGTVPHIGEDALTHDTYDEQFNRGLVRKYGVRLFDTASELVGQSDQCRLLGKSLMRRMNADIISAQVTIDLRPELRAGNPVYIPELNRVFYVATVTHTFAPGSASTTSVGLQYGRTPWDILPELLTYYPDEKSGTYGTGSSFNNLRGKTVSANPNFTHKQQRTVAGIQYVIFHHNYPETNFTYDIILGKDGKPYVTSLWNANVSGKQLLTSESQLSKTTSIGNVDPSIFTVDEKKKINIYNTMHVCFESDLNRKTYISGLDAKALVSFLNFLMRGYSKFTGLIASNTTAGNAAYYEIASRCLVHSDKVIGDNHLCGVNCIGSIASNVNQPNRDKKTLEFTNLYTACRHVINTFGVGL